MLQLFGSDAETGAIPSYGESNAATMTVLAADLIAAGIQLESGGLVANQDVLSITGGAAKTAMGGQFGPFEQDLSAAGVTVTGGTQQTGNEGAVSLQAGVGALVIGDLFPVITSNPTNCGPDGIINGVTLTGTSSNNGIADVTITGNTIASPVTVTTAGTGYNAGEVVTIAAGDLGTGLFVQAGAVTSTNRWRNLCYGISVSFLSSNPNYSRYGNNKQETGGTIEFSNFRW